jgi:hypothetical protein
MDVFSAFVAVSVGFWTGIALLIAMARATVRPLPQFSLRSLFVMTAIVAGFSYFIFWCRNFYYFQLQDVRAALAEHPEIDRVWFGTNDDVQLEVEQVYFSIKGQPDMTFYFDGIDYVGKREFRKRLERALMERQPVVRPDWVVEYGIR